MQNKNEQPSTGEVVKGPRRSGVVRFICKWALILLALYFGMGAMVAWISIKPKHFRVLATPSIYKMPYERIRFQSYDGTSLIGWFISAHGAAKGVVVLCHGIDSEKSEMLGVAQTLHRNGYSMLLFDFRARGESEGRICTLGYREVEDLLSGVDFIQRRADSKGLPVGVLGESLGGSVALMGTARRPDIRAVVAESPFACMDHAVDNHFNSAFGVMGSAVAMPVRWFGEWMIGKSCSDISPAKEIAKVAPRPILLVQDEDDSLCPPSETRELMKNAHGPKQLWTVKKAGHIEAQLREAKEYESRVVTFFDRTLHGREPVARTNP